MYANKVRAVGRDFPRYVDVAIARGADPALQWLIFFDSLHVEIDFEERGMRSPRGLGRLARLRWLEREVEHVIVDHDRRDCLRTTTGAFGVLKEAIVDQHFALHL